MQIQNFFYYLTQKQIKFEKKLPNSTSRLNNQHNKQEASVYVLVKIGFLKLKRGIAPSTYQSIIMKTCKIFL